VQLTGAAVSGAAAWWTPLGPVPVDEELCDRAIGAGAVIDDRPHVHDHAVEVQLPFLQRRTGDALRVLPVAVGGGAARDAAALVEALAQTALVVVSTDLSHYHDVATAQRLDRRTAESIVALDDRAIGDMDACGAHALRGLLAYARKAGWACTLLDLRTSADSGGPTDGVVGYGAFAFTSEPPA
jgi:AmmeMemoRadiSam system protein B